MVECVSLGSFVQLPDDFYIECPDAQDFCMKFERRCPMDCSGNGICLGNRKCFCFGDISTPDCVNDISNNQQVSTNTTIDQFVLDSNFTIRNVIRGNSGPLLLNSMIGLIMIDLIFENY